MFWTSLCPSSGEQDCLMPRVVFAWLCWPRLCGAGTQAAHTVWNLLFNYNNNFHTVRTACVPAPHDRGQHNLANTTRGIKQSCSPDDGHNDAQNMLRVN